MEPSLVFERQPSEGCSKHPGESIQTYCNTCNELLCSRCLMRGHDNHIVSSYSDYLMRRLKQAEKHLHRLTSINQRAENLKSRLCSYGNEFERYYGDSLKMLNNFEKVRVGMKAWKENVTAELEQKKTNQLQQIDKFIDSNGDLEGLVIKLPKVSIHKLLKETLPLKVKELTPNSVIALKNTYYYVRRHHSHHNYSRASIASSQSDFSTISSRCESSRSTSSFTDHDEDLDSMSSYSTALDSPHGVDLKFKEVQCNFLDRGHSVGEFFMYDDHMLLHSASQTSQLGHPDQQERERSSIQSSSNPQQLVRHEDTPPLLPSGLPNQQTRWHSSIQSQLLSSNPQQWDNTPPPIPSGHPNQQERHHSPLQSQSLSTNPRQWDDHKDIPLPFPSGHDHFNEQERHPSSFQSQTLSNNLQQWDDHKDVPPPLPPGHPNQQERHPSSFQSQALSNNPQQWDDHKDVPPPLPSGHPNQQERHPSSFQSQTLSNNLQQWDDHKDVPPPLPPGHPNQQERHPSSFQSQALSNNPQQWDDHKDVPPPLPSGHPNQQERHPSSLQSQTLSNNPQQLDNHKDVPPPPLLSGHPNQQESELSSLQSQSHGSKDSTRQQPPFPLYANIKTKDKDSTSSRMRTKSDYSHLDYFRMEHPPPLQGGHHPIQKTISAPFFSRPYLSIIPAVSPIEEQLPSSPDPYLLPCPSTSGSIESRILNASNKDIVPPHCDYDSLENATQAMHTKSNLSLEESEYISPDEVVYDDPLTLTASKTTNKASQPTPYQPLYSASKVQPYHPLNVTSQFSATATTSTMDTYGSHLMNNTECKKKIIRPSNIILNSCLAETPGEYVSLYDVCVDPDGSMIFSDRKNLCLRILMGTTESSKRMTKRFKNNIHGQPKAIAYDKLERRILLASDGCLTQVEYSEDLKKIKSRKLSKGFTPLSITCTMTGGSSSFYVTVWPKEGKPCIHHLDHNGQFQRMLLSSDITKKPWGIDYIREYLVVSTLEDGCLTKISPSGNPLWESNVDARTPGILQQPFGVAILPNEYIAVTECSAHRVSVFSNDGKLVLRFGELGSDPGKFNTPQGIAVRLNKELVVVDSGNDRIQIFSLDSLELPQSLPVEFEGSYDYIY